MSSTCTDFVDFGFYPNQIELTSTDFSITTLPGLEETVTAVLSDEYAEDGWIYSPPQRTRHFPSGEITSRPYRARVFGLPKTHRLTHIRTEHRNHLRFLLWCFGFFVGMRMSETQAGFLDATPIEPGRTHDFLCMGNDLRLALEHAESFWNSHSGEPRVEAAIRGAIHSYFISQMPRLLDFEKFIYLYITLEGCHRVSSYLRNLDPTKGGHPERVERLCMQFGMTVPNWAESTAKRIVSIRNYTFHEGLFFGEPLGFQIFGGNHNPTNDSDSFVLLQMSALCSRLIIALLGMERSSYVTSAIDTRQRHGLHLI